MSTECNIGGGEEINGFEDGGPPTLCQPASQQGGEEEVKTWQEEPGGGWRSAGVSGENFWVAFIQGVTFTTSRVLWFGRPLLTYQASAGWIGEGRVE